MWSSYFPALVVIHLCLLLDITNLAFTDNPLHFVLQLGSIVDCELSVAMCHRFRDIALDQCRFRAHAYFIRDG